MSTRTRAAIALGLILILSGTVAGLRTTTIPDSSATYASATGTTLNCGSPWAPTIADAQDHALLLSPDETRQRCQDSHGSTGTIAAILVAIGALTLLSSSVLARSRN